MRRVARRNAPQPIRDIPAAYPDTFFQPRLVLFSERFDTVNLPIRSDGYCQYIYSGLWTESFSEQEG